MTTASQPRKPLWQRLWSVFDPNERYLRGIQPQVDQINALEPEFENLSQQDLRDRLLRIRSRVLEARQAVEAQHAQLPPPEDSDTRRRRQKEIVDAEKVVLDEHLAEVFAAVREAAKRTLSMRHFDVQLLGGIVLHEGRIAEMKTGEGKTLTATCPLVLNALAGRGAHLVTVNDYLARLHAEWMGKIYRYLGLTVGVIQHDLSREERQASYGCDITYITNHEIGFDYLRDHSSAWRPEHLVIRELHYAIIDEVDSILIDEARVPLIISASRGKPVEKYRKIQEIVSRLALGTQDLETKETTGDFYVDEKAKNATLTEDGQRKVEIALGIDNLNDSAHIEDMHLVNAALKANFCYKRDVDYIVGPGDYGPLSVIIVDTFTGRPQPGRRWSDGLHQAIEAKERVPIQDEQQTIATVTYQNFFLMYNRMAGMTGTAKTEEAEFVGIYNMPAVVVPTNRPMIRTEHPDVVYKTEEWKLRGICCEIVQYYLRRQPVLVGTRSVETSERVSARLKPDRVRMTLQLMLLQWHIMEHEKKLDKALLRELRQASTAPLELLRPRDVIDFLKRLDLDPELDTEANLAAIESILEVSNREALLEVLQHGVPHEVLNARHHEREAQIVAQAGRLGAITIATNMAGRGTDIILGGNPEPDLEDLLTHRGVDPKSLEATLFINQALKGDPVSARSMADDHGGLPATVLHEMAAIRSAWRAEQQDVIATGGLHILGTERLESRRIDNQLRGRSGRQGDPGASRFYVSLQDELMRLFGPERWGLLMNQWPEEQPVEAKLITRAMGNAQKKVEGRNFDMRKNTLRYDDVMNVQRQHIYAERRRILEGVDLRETVAHMMGDLVDEALNLHAPSDTTPADWDLTGLWAFLNQKFPLKDQLAFEDLADLSREALAERLRAAAMRAYDDKENDFIRSVVEFELQASIHETLQQVPDRDPVCQVLNALWPLQEQLPARLAGLPDAKVPETLLNVAREALESGPRQFLAALVRDRLQRAAAAVEAEVIAGAELGGLLTGLQRDWPVRVAADSLQGLEPAEVGSRLTRQLVGALDEQGWSFVTQALQRQMAATVESAVSEHCDLNALVDSLLSLWPLHEGLDVDQLATFNFGVIDDRLRRLADQAVEQAGHEFLAQAAEHRLRWAWETATAEADPAWLGARLSEILPATTPARAGDHQTAEAFIDGLYDQAYDGVLLRAVEEVAVAAVVAAHRQMSAGAEGEGDDEEELAFGDLRRLVDRLSEQWALGEALNPWELERVPAGEVRRELADRTRAAIRTRGRRFVTETANLRLQGLVDQAVEQHYSVTGVLARLSQEFELAGIFDASNLADVWTPADLVEQLTGTAEQALSEEPERLEAVVKAIPLVVADGLNLRKLVDRLNQELRPPRKLETGDLAEVPADELAATILERLDWQEGDTFEDRLGLEWVRQHVHLSIDQALERYYDLRRVSATIAATWPVRPDAVRASKLKGWMASELPKRLKDLLNEAYRWEEWRFARRFAMRLVQDGLREALDTHCPVGAPGSAWDLPALCDELAERWQIDTVPQPAELPTYSRELLVDLLLNAARRAYGEQERAFVRETARHRFGMQVQALRREHYSLVRAATEVGGRWQLGNAITPLALDEVRALLDQPAAADRVIAELVEPVLETAQAAFYQDCLNRRLTDSVDAVLESRYNTDSLVREVLGRWPLTQGGLQPEALRALPFREMVERVRQLILNASGALQRRLVFHNLRQILDEVGRSELLAADPATWRLDDFAAALNAALPLGGMIQASEVAAGLLQRALAEPLATARQAIGTQPTPALAALVERRVAARLDALIQQGERRPHVLAERLDEVWPGGAQADVNALRGQPVAAIREALLAAARASYQADPAAALAAAAHAWAGRCVSEAISQYWPDEGTPGPWVLAQITLALNTRWNAPDLLHPSTYKGLDRDLLTTDLGLRAAAVDALTPFLGELVEQDLAAAAAAAATAALRGAGQAWDLARAAATLAERWPTASAPSAPELAAALTPAAVTAELQATVERLERRIVAEYATEPVLRWFERRLDRALERLCSLSGVCQELAERWPINTIDAGRLGELAYQQVREALVQALLDVAQRTGAGFVTSAAKQRLDADLAAVVAQVTAAAPASEASLAALLARWPWQLQAAQLSGLDAARATATLQAAAAPFDELTLQRTFLYETVRRRLRQAVVEAQHQYCDPDISSDRWDVPALIAALEKDWPIAGRLTVADLSQAAADTLREKACTVLEEAFARDQQTFLAATLRQQVGHTIREALAEHASLERLCTVLGEQWPRPADFTPDGVRAALGEELAEALTGWLASVLRRSPEDLRAAVEELAAQHVGRGPLDLAAVAAEVARRWPDARALPPAELDEALIAEYLETRLWLDFQEEPHAFVRAVALEDVPRQLERRLMLDAIDTNWCDHLEAMDYLKEGINLRGYAQTDPFIAYRKEGRTMFENMLGRIRETVVAGLFETTERQLVEMHSHGRLGLRIAVEFQNVQEMAAKAEDLTAAHTPPHAPARSGGGDGVRRAAPAAPGQAPAAERAPVVAEKVGRNDPCPCGSGKKYKFCCGRK